jgi:hypothetical protein
MATCKHEETRYLHLTLKECREAECQDASQESCDLVICVGCGEDAYND